MANYKELDEALALVYDHATTEQIQDLLRTRKDHKSVKITAETKDLLVHRNLKEAVEGRAIDIEKVFDLIRDAEENGGQHIFYYKAKSKAIADKLTLKPSLSACLARIGRRNWRMITLKSNSSRMILSSVTFDNSKESRRIGS